VRELFEHGILNERADIRAHVGVTAKMVFVFKTRDGVEAAKGAEERFAWQPGVNDGPTANGWVVPIESIIGLRTIRIPNWPAWAMFLGNENDPVEKGKIAVSIVLDLMKRAGFPFWVDAAESKDVNIQKHGTDIFVGFKKMVQVKCDWTAGPKSIRGCSGNLYLQTAERNPLRRY